MTQSELHPTLHLLRRGVGLFTNYVVIEAIKVSMKALSQKILWQGVFPTEAFQWHREQALTIS